MDQTNKLFARLAALEDQRSSINHDIKALRRVAREALTAPVAKPFVPHVQVVRPQLVPDIPLRQQLRPVSEPTNPNVVHNDNTCEKYLRQKEERDKEFAILVPHFRKLWMDVLPLPDPFDVQAWSYLLRSHSPFVIDRAIYYIKDRLERKNGTRILSVRGYFISLLRSLEAEEEAKSSVE